MPDFKKARGRKNTTSFSTSQTAPQNGLSVTELLRLSNSSPGNGIMKQQTQNQWFFVSAQTSPSETTQKNSLNQNLSTTDRMSRSTLASQRLVSIKHIRFPPSTGNIQLSKKTGNPMHPSFYFVSSGTKSLFSKNHYDYYFAKHQTPAKTYGHRYINTPYESCTMFSKAFSVVMKYLYVLKISFVKTHLVTLQEKSLR